MGNVVALPMTEQRLVIGETYGSPMATSKWTLDHVIDGYCYSRQKFDNGRHDTKVHRCKTSAFVKWINGDPDHAK